MDFKKLKKMEEVVRIGGKGSMRRKHKRFPSSAAAEKRVQATLAMLPLKNIDEIEEVTIEFTNSSKVVLTMPRVQSTAGNSFFVVSGDFVRKSSTAGPSKVAKAANAPKAPMPPKPPKPEAFSDKKPESEESIKVAKKPKKPRNRVRPRNKKVQMMLSKNKEDAAMAGWDSEPKLSNGKPILISSEDGSDPDNEKVPSDESDVDRTIVCDKDSLGSFGDDSDGKEDVDTTESIYLSSYSNYYYLTEQLYPNTYRVQVSEDED
uniref:Transcription factor BTF3 n=2 Tax=Drosophila melanogaster TaxID=7227 RepID=Q9VY63_DROME|eukprot:NP_572938.2 Nascent-associated complex beta-subunit-like, testis 1 [Drosophila melanogaster]